MGAFLLKRLLTEPPGITNVKSLQI